MDAEKLGSRPPAIAGCVRVLQILTVLEVHYYYLHDLDRFICWGNSREQPIHLQGMGELEDDSSTRRSWPIVREMGMISVSGGICGMK